MSKARRRWGTRGSMLLVALVGALGLASWVTFVRSRRARSSGRIDDELRRILTTPGARAARVDLELRYLERLDEYVQHRIAGEPVRGLPDEELDAGASLDSLMSGLEHLLSLLAQGAIPVDEVDEVDEVIRYWTRALLDRPEQAGLRLYLQDLGCPLLAGGVGLEDPRLIAVYGTLRDDRRPVDDGADLPRLTVVRRGCELPGRLYDVGEYPAAQLDRPALHGRTPVEATILVDLLRIHTDEDLGDALRRLDDYEGVSRSNGDGLYRRMFVPVDGRGAWFYDWMQPVDHLPEIPSGSWPG